jgi:hypothetical protein
VQGALTWLEENQDKPLEELQAQPSKAAAADEAGDAENDAEGPSIAALESGEPAKSLVCNDCGKKFRSQELASFHASKT